jgi:DNA-binding transcriptional ArsR family regulator
MKDNFDSSRFLGTLSKCLDIKISKETPSKQNEHFLKGPIPLDWLTSATRLPGKATVVALALWYRAGVTKSFTVKPSHTLWNRFGIGRSAAYRGLSALEGANLVQVQRRVGKNPIVRIRMDS